MRLRMLVCALVVSACTPLNTGQSGTAPSPMPTQTPEPIPSVSAPAPEGALIQDDFTARRQTILDLTNAERAKAGLKPLRMNAKLEQAAQSHAKTMAETLIFEHEVNGVGASQRIEATGYDFQRVAENLHFGSSQPGDTINAWMDSPGHRQNILTPELEELGVGIALSDRNKRTYWVQNFGTSF